MKLLIAVKDMRLINEVKTLVNDNKLAIEIEGTVKSYNELTNKLTTTKINTLFIEFNSNYGFSIEEIKKLNIQYPLLRFLVYSVNTDIEDMIVLLRIPIHGFVMNKCGESGLLNAFNALQTNQKFLCPRATNLLINQVVKGENTLNINNIEKVLILTERESEVATLLIKGYTTKVIAELLCVSIHTVSTHRKNIYKKLNIHSVPELLQFR